MILKNRAIVFDARSMRFEEWNGHLRVANTNLTKANICEYYGFEINNYQKYGLDPKTKYRFLRSPDALKLAVDSFKERPVLYVHKTADADHLDNSKVIGTTGSDPQFNYPYIQSSMTIWDGDYIQAIKDNTQAELSASYAFTPVMGKGTFEGEDYDGVMTNIFVDHVALVAEGRAGPDVRVSDEKVKIMLKLNKTGLKISSALAGLLNKGTVNDATGNKITEAVEAASGTKRKVFGKVLRAILQSDAIASDAEAEKIDETVKKAMDEDLEGDYIGDEDPVKTLEDEDPEEDNKSSASDENDENDPAQTKDEDPKDNKGANASDAKIKGSFTLSKSSSNQAQAFDAASLERSIEQRIMAKAKQAQEARLLVKPLVGEWAITEDSGETILRTALTELTGKTPPSDMNYTGLKYVVDLAVSQKTQPKVSDSARNSHSDLQRFGATRLRSI